MARHAKGAHAKRPNPALKILGLVIALAIVTVLAPALIGFGLIFGIVTAWIARGLTKI